MEHQYLRRRRYVSREQTANKLNYQPKHQTNNGPADEIFRANSFLKTNFPSASQEISCILRELKINYKVDNSRQIVPFLKRENPDSVQIFLSFNTYFKIILPRSHIFRRGLNPLAFPTKKVCKCFSIKRHAIYATNFIKFDLMSII